MIFPDISFTALRMSKKNNSATMADHQNINYILKKVRERKNCIKFKNVRDKECLIVVGIGDASFQ